MKARSFRSKPKPTAYAARPARKTFASNKAIGGISTDVLESFDQSLNCARPAGDNRRAFCLLTMWRPKPMRFEMTERLDTLKKARERMIEERDAHAKVLAA